MLALIDAVVEEAKMVMNPTRPAPIISAEVGWSCHLVSPYGGSDGVRNLRAAGKGELSRKGRSEVFHAVEIPVGQRGSVISRYREVAGRAVDSYFTKLPDARDHPVFQIDSGNPVR